MKIELDGFSAYMVKTLIINRIQACECELLQMKAKGTAIIYPHTVSFYETEISLFKGILNQIKDGSRTHGATATNDNDA